MNLLQQETQVVPESNGMSYGRGGLWSCNSQKKGEIETKPRYIKGLRLSFLPSSALLHPAKPAVGQRVEANTKLPVGKHLPALDSKEG